MCHMIWHFTSSGNSTDALFIVGAVFVSRTPASYSSHSQRGLRATAQGPDIRVALVMSFQCHSYSNNRAGCVLRQRPRSLESCPCWRVGSHGPSLRAWQGVRQPDRLASAHNTTQPEQDPTAARDSARVLCAGSCDCPALDNSDDSQNASDVFSVHSAWDSGSRFAMGQYLDHFFNAFSATWFQGSATHMVKSESRAGSNRASCTMPLIASPNRRVLGQNARFPARYTGRISVVMLSASASACQFMVAAPQTGLPEPRGGTTSRRRVSASH